MSGNHEQIEWQPVKDGLAMLLRAVVLAFGLASFAPAQMPEPVLAPPPGAAGGGGSGTISRPVYYQAAGCDGSTAATGFNRPASNAPAAECVTFDTDKKAAVLSFDQSTDESVFGHFQLPASWTSTLAAQVTWRTTATTGDVVWAVQVACLATGEQYSDISWNTPATVTTIAQGVAGDFATSALSSITVTGCAASELLFWWFYRDANAAGDTLAADASVFQLRFDLEETL